MMVAPKNEHLRTGLIARHHNLRRLDKNQSVRTVHFDSVSTTRFGGHHRDGVEAEQG